MSTFVPNPTAGQLLLRSGELRRSLLALVEEAAARAQDLAPDDPETPGSEDLHGSILGEVALTPEGWRGRLLARNYKAPFWEFGTVQNAPRPFLAPAVEALGLKVEPPTGDTFGA